MNTTVLAVFVLLCTSTVINDLYANSAGTGITHSDSTVYAKVVIYRPDNQLTRKYRLNTNLKGAFEMARKEVVMMDAYSNSLEISVGAFGHKSERFSFVLSKDKVHYFRVQDRNNYSGFLAFLEVIEVTEETYKREKR